MKLIHYWLFCATRRAAVASRSRSAETAQKKSKKILRIGFAATMEALEHPLNIAKNHRLQKSINITSLQRTRAVSAHG